MVEFKELTKGKPFKGKGEIKDFVDIGFDITQVNIAFIFQN